MAENNLYLLPSKNLNGKITIGNSDARLGFEPKLTPSKGVVLPLHYRAD